MFPLLNPSLRKPADFLIWICWHDVEIPEKFAQTPKSTKSPWKNGMKRECSTCSSLYPLKKGNHFNKNKWLYFRTLFAEAYLGAILARKVLSSQTLHRPKLEIVNEKMFPDFTRKQKRKYAQQKTQISEKKKNIKSKMTLFACRNPQERCSASGFNSAENFFWNMANG